MVELALIPRDRILKSSFRVKAAKPTWSAYVKDRWPRDTLNEVRGEWDLTEWEARTVVYGSISQATEDKIFRHRRWKLLDAFDFFLYRSSTTCNELADQLDKEAEFERLDQNRRHAPRQRVALRLAPERVSGPEASEEVASFDGPGDRP